MFCDQINIFYVYFCHAPPVREIRNSFETFTSTFLPLEFNLNSLQWCSHETINVIKLTNFYVLNTLYINEKLFSHTFGCIYDSCFKCLNWYMTISSLDYDLYINLSHTFSYFYNYINLFASLFSKRKKKILISLTKEKLSTYRKIAFICQSLKNTKSLFFVIEQRKISGIVAKRD